MSGFKTALIAISAVGLLAITTLVVFAYPPAQFNFYPKCMLFQWTGLHCPGCGGTRAVHELTRGRILDAIRMNALVVLFLPVLIAALLWQNGFSNQKKPFLHLVTGPKTAWAIAILVIGFGLLRNIPMPPFSWLAPQQVEIQAGSQTKQ